MTERGIDATGPAFLRYHAIEAAGEMDIEFGVFTDRPYAGNGPVRPGILPAGSYVSATWFGPYEALPDVDVMLMGWSQQKRMEWDTVSNDAGVSFGCRISIFHKTPRIETDAARFETEVAIRLRDAGSTGS